MGLEICDAQQGEYSLTIKEHGADPYVLDVTVRGSTPEQESESLLLHHLPEEGRILQYKFRYILEKRRVVITWIDKNGNAKLEIEPNDW